MIKNPQSEHYNCSHSNGICHTNPRWSSAGRLMQESEISDKVEHLPVSVPFDLEQARLISNLALHIHMWKQHCLVGMSIMALVIMVLLYILCVPSQRERLWHVWSSQQVAAGPEPQECRITGDQYGHAQCACAPAQSQD